MYIVQVAVGTPGRVKQLLQDGVLQVLYPTSAV